MGMAGGDGWGDWEHFAEPLRPPAPVGLMVDEDVTGKGRLNRTRADGNGPPQATPEVLPLRAPRR